MSGASFRDGPAARVEAREAEARWGAELARVRRGVSYERVGGGGVPPGVLFAVKVWAAGGSWGAQNARCSIVYNVRTIDATSTTTGTALGSSMTPKKLRPALGRLAGAASTGEGTVGCGYYDATNTFCLYDANETLFTEAC